MKAEAINNIEKAGAIDALEKAIGSHQWDAKQALDRVLQDRRKNFHAEMGKARAALAAMDALHARVEARKTKKGSSR